MSNAQFTTEIEQPTTFVLRGARTVRLLGRLGVISAIACGVLAVIAGKTIDDKLGIAFGCAVMAVAAYGWMRWVGARHVDTLFLWNDGLEIVRDGVELKVPWNEVQVAAAFTGRHGFVAVRIATSRGFRLMAALEGGDTLSAISSALDLYRLRALGS